MPGPGYTGPLLQISSWRAYPARDLKKNTFFPFFMVQFWSQRRIYIQRASGRKQNNRTKGGLLCFRDLLISAWSAEHCCGFGINIVLKLSIAPIAEMRS